MDQLQEQHVHGADCGCGTHHHPHEHSADCGCQEYTGGIQGLSDEEAKLLRLIGQFGSLPLARFVLTSTKDDSLHMSALEPAAIEHENESIETVKQRGEVLLSLEDKGLITLDYDIPISGYEYEGYQASAIFSTLQSAAQEAASKPGFLFDTAAIDRGSMALTDMGDMLLS
ncbi:MAG: hypothetical protein GX781_03675 [Clostridiales bacterium]|nr:hypothetical protein [Clostridiales bacterium]